jgi:hypothetical protein
MPAIGPSEGQERVLIEIGEDLETYRNIPREHITSILQSRLGEYRPTVIGKVSNTFLAKRLKVLETKRLKVRMLVRVKKSKKPRKITDISIVTGYLKVEGMNRDVSPQEVFPIEEDRRE